MLSRINFNVDCFCPLRTIQPIGIISRRQVRLNLFIEIILRTYIPIFLIYWNIPHNKTDIDCVASNGHHIFAEEVDDVLLVSNMLFAF